jgi:hypothetical protein
MPVSSRRNGGNDRNYSALYGGFAVTLGVGVAVATGHAVAWADSPSAHSADGSVRHSGSSPGTGDSAKPDRASLGSNAPGVTGSGAAGAVHGIHRGTSPSMNSSGGMKTSSTHTPGGTPDASPTADVTALSSTPAATSAPTTPSIATDTAARSVQVAAGRGTSQTAKTDSSAHPASPTQAVGNSGPAQLAGSSLSASGDMPIAAHTALAMTASPASGTEVSTSTVSTAQVSTAAVSTAAVITAPSTPAAVSPITTILSLPASIANAVLGFFGIQTASGTTPTPISPAPLVQAVFAVFREIENIAGLDTPPAVQPALTSETFTGSLTTPTPTVAEFLDAATTEYTLGGQPGGLTPFTVNGVPVTDTNDITGTAAQVWVTPQNQIIIAYSGTTGGTNLLFNPLIAVTEVLDDAQQIFTQTTPPAFPDALNFEQQVQAEAAEQGYSPNSIFVTGHSLGGWEAEYVAENTGLGGIGFESLGLNTTVPGNGADSLFVNTATYGDPAGFFASDLPGEQPFAPAYVPGGGSDPHYGPIVLLGNPSSGYPLTNAAADLWGTSIVGDLLFGADALVNLLEYHLPGNQAYNLDVDPEPDLLPGTAADTGPVYDFGDLTIPEFLQAASTDGILIEP